MTAPTDIDIYAAVAERLRETSKRRPDPDIEEIIEYDATGVRVRWYAEDDGVDEVEQAERAETERVRVRRLLGLDGVEEDDTPEPPKPKRRRKPSAARTVASLRKAGERGPVRIEQVNADGSRTCSTPVSVAVTLSAWVGSMSMAT